MVHLPFVWWVRSSLLLVWLVMALTGSSFLTRCIDRPVRTEKELPELAEERAHVVYEQIGRFHRWEVPALLELREMNDLDLRVHEAPHNRVGVEDGPPLRCRRRG